jgi:hypothetical protein
MKMQVFNIDLSDFIAGKQIDEVVIHDHSLCGHQSILFVVYFPIINKLTIIKCLASAEESMKDCLLLDSEYAIFYTLND